MAHGHFKIEGKPMPAYMYGTVGQITPMASTNSQVAQRRACRCLDLVEATR